MKYKTVIVDDELEAQKRLLLHLKKFREVQLLDSCKNGKEALRTIKKERPDIVFMDIEMPEMNGIQVLANCPEPYPYFIFVTAYDQYAVEAFEQNAVDYILKPYTHERIAQALDRAIGMIEKDRLAEITGNLKDLVFSFSQGIDAHHNKEYLRRIAVKSIGHTIFLDVADIILIEAADQYVEVSTTGKKYTVRESMDKLERKLDPKAFFRTHRSYIVRLDQVIALENVDKHISLVTLKNNQKIKISNSRKPDFKLRMGT
ncbi:LytTR family DNA-binding domain-containing protein [Ulvibacterium sp.]|uniref:LytR/AlgR family response regulator transcription factor n=1 Tax=Ulvibacterium sp. TaxID=2665914 RepID=UPI002605F9EB|nr:LytTR family DNA-binding domain-containing protein [Ulvibacterium sp.]